MKLNNSFEITAEEVRLILTSVTTPQALKTWVLLALLAVIAWVAWLYFGKPGG